MLNVLQCCLMNEVWVSVVHKKPVVSYRIVKSCWVYAQRRRLDLWVGMLKN